MSTLIVKILTTIRKFPTRNGGEMGRCMVALEKENNAVSLISTPDHFNQLVIDKCVRLVLAVRTEKHITIGGRAKVFNTRKFSVSETAYNSVFNAPEKPLLELANRSDETKLRFSTFGVIKSIGGMMTSADNVSWRRREVDVEHDNTTIRLKLWGHMVDIVDDNFLGQSVVIKNIVVDRYKGSNTLASTDQTTISLHNGDVVTKVFKVAGWITRDCLRVCDEDDHEYQVDATITGEELDELVGVEVKCQVLNNSIQEINENDVDDSLLDDQE